MILRVHYFTLFWILGYMLSVWIDAAAFKNKCHGLPQQSVDNIIKNLTAENSKLHWSFWLLPSLQKAAEETLQHEDLAVTRKSRYSFLYGEYGRRCPKRNRPRMNVCPVYYVMQNDKNRIPENIVHTRCNCNSCFKQRDSLLTGKCEQVFALTTVLRRNETTCEYYNSMESVAVSCTCKIRDVKIIPANSSGLQL